MTPTSSSATEYYRRVSHTSVLDFTLCSAIWWLGMQHLSAWILSSLHHACIWFMCSVNASVCFLQLVKFADPFGIAGILDVFTSACFPAACKYFAASVPVSAPWIKTQSAGVFCTDVRIKRAVFPHEGWIERVIFLDVSVMKQICVWHKNTWKACRNDELLL